MTLSMHQASAPLFIHTLQALSRVLQVAEEEVAAGRLDEAELMEARLAPDMLAFPKQIQIATDSVKGCLARLAGETAPSWPDEEKTLAELQARVAKAIDYAKTFPPEKIDGSEEKTIHLKFGQQPGFDLSGQALLLHMAIPNFFFHVTTAYDILRHKGAPLKKAHFLGQA
jgi:uncharacterized protein